MDGPVTPWMSYPDTSAHQSVRLEETNRCLTNRPTWSPRDEKNSTCCPGWVVYYESIKRALKIKYIYALSQVADGVFFFQGTSSCKFRGLLSSKKMCRALYVVVALMLPHVSQPFCSSPGVVVTASSRWLTPAGLLIFVLLLCSYIIPTHTFTHAHRHTNTKWYIQANKQRRRSRTPHYRTSAFACVLPRLWYYQSIILSQSERERERERES